MCSTPQVAAQWHPRRYGGLSPAAARVYQDAAGDRDAEIARAPDAMLGAVTEVPDEHSDERPQ